jgi:NADH-quinone oxidoreductase subunit M
VKSSLAHIVDITPRELACLAPLVILTIFFGIYPSPLLDVFGTPVEAILALLR